MPHEFALVKIQVFVENVACDRPDVLHHGVDISLHESKILLEKILHTFSQSKYLIFIKLHDFAFVNYVFVVIRAVCEISRGCEI